MIPYLLFWLLVALPPEWKDWRNSRAIFVKGPGLTTFALPPPASDRAAAEISDVRIVDGEGHEVPFALQKRPPHAELAWRSCKMLADNSKAGYTDVVIDTTEENTLHNLLQMEISDPDFLAKVNIQASDKPDSSPADMGWRTVRTGIPIYRYRPDGLEGSQTVQFPENYSRYLRVKITPDQPEGTLDAAAAAHVAPLHLIHFQVAYDDSKQPDWVAYMPIFTPELSTSNLQSWWRSDALSSALPVTGIRVTTLTKEFHRAVRISTSLDGRNWSSVYSTDIFRTTGEHPFERTSIEFPETTVRYWRLQFFDNGYPPLTISKIELMGAPYHVVFQASDKTPYRLLYANGRVVAGDYEMSRLLERNAYQVAAQATLGEEEVNTVQTRGYVKWLLIGGGVLLLIAVGVMIALLTEDSEDSVEEM